MQERTPEQRTQDIGKIHPRVGRQRHVGYGGGTHCVHVTSVKTDEGELNLSGKRTRETLIPLAEGASLVGRGGVRKMISPNIPQTVAFISKIASRSTLAIRCKRGKQNYRNLHFDRLCQVTIHKTGYTLVYL